MGAFNGGLKYQILRLSSEMPQTGSPLAMIKAL